MSILQQLPKDPGAAAEILAALDAKDKDEAICRYPTCYASRQATIGTSGRPSAYCSDPEHNANHSRRARLQLDNRQRSR